MAKYQWNIRQIEMYIKWLNDYLKNEKNPLAKEIIICHIVQYKEMLDKIIMQSKNDDNIINEQCYLSPNELIETFTDGITRLDFDIINFVANTFSIIKDVNPPLQINPIICDNDTLVANSEMILENFCDEITYNQYLDFKKKNPDFLQIHHEKVVEKYNGYTFIDSILRKKYVLINRCNQAVDLVALPHELFHLVFNDYDCIASAYYQSYYTNEIEGSLANFLTADFYRGKIEGIAENINNTYFETYKELVFNLIVGVSYIHSCDEKGHFRNNKFHKVLNSFDTNYKLDQDNIQFWLNTNARELLNYSISYLASLDLYTIYQNDKELALYLLKNIKYLKKDNDVMSILRRNHITFMDDGCENLKKFIKKINKPVNYTK